MDEVEGVEKRSTAHLRQLKEDLEHRHRRKVKNHNQPEVEAEVEVEEEVVDAEELMIQIKK